MISEIFPTGHWTTTHSAYKSPKLHSSVTFTPQLQRELILRRWRRNDAIEKQRTVKDETVRKRLQSRLIGYLQGDGSVGRNYDKATGRYHHNIMFYPDHIKVAELFANTFYELYGRRINIKKLENHYKVRVCHRVAYQELTSMTTFDSLGWQAPYNLLHDVNSKREWLSAMFDCESYVGPRTIVVNSVNKRGLLQVQQLLQEFGIQTRFYQYQRKQKNWNTNYILAISRISDRQTFLKRIGFNHPRKQEKLKEYLAAVA